MINDHLLIKARNSTLPEDPETKKRTLKALKTAIANACIDFDIHPDSVAVYDGPIYSQVDLTCPDCRGSLTLRDFQPGPSNDADATAECHCGFSGRAVYRVIDIERNTDTSTADAMFDTGSCAVDGLPVQYTPYENTGHHIL